MGQTLKRKRVLNNLANIGILIAGNATYAAAVVLFVLPSSLVMGGITGVSILLKNFLPFDISYMVFAMNLGLFVLGSAVLGRHFAVTTAASTVLYPFFIHIFERIFKDVVLTDDLVLCAAASGIMIGFAVGFVARSGASTGGMDIPPLVINKLTGAPVGTTMALFDATIIAVQLIVSSVTQTLYGIIMVIIYSYVINQVMVMGNGKIQISIVSEKVDEMRAAILTETRRGVTMISARKGLTGENCEMVMTVVYNRQLAQAKRIILDVDPAAFMVITKVSEVNGNGFSFSKGDKKLDKTDIMK